jgi:hypothetical protein
MVLKGTGETVVQCSGERTVKVIKLTMKTWLGKSAFIISQKPSLSDDMLIKKLIEFIVCFRCASVAAKLAGRVTGGTDLLVDENYTFHSRTGALFMEATVRLIKPCSSNVFNIFSTVLGFMGFPTCF